MVNPTVDLVIQLALMFAIGVALAALFLIICRWISPKSKNPNKGLPYECGVLPKNEARVPYNVHFYLVAVLFVLFDLMAVFVYPWAISLRPLGVTALIQMLVFIGILLVGYVYALKKGVFDWE